MKKLYIFKLVSLTTLTLGLVLTAACSQGQVNPLIGNPAPVFNLKTLEGSTLSFESVKGKTILINFWSTTCPPCVDEMPYFQKLQDNWSNRNDAKLVMIDLNEALSTVQDFIQTNKYTFQVLLDGGYISAQAYQVSYTPTTVLIDRKGIVRIYKIGAFTNFTDIQNLTTSFLNK